MPDASFYKWQARYGRMGSSMIGKMKALRDVNRWWKKTEVAMNL